MDYSPADLETSAEIDAIAKALPSAQAAMTAILLDSVNSHFENRYASLKAVVEAVTPALNAAGIAVLQPVGFDGERVNITTMLLHESGQWMRATHSMPVPAKNPQGIGSAVTYGRRQGLAALLGVAPEAGEDDDGEAGSRPGGGQGKFKKAEPPSLAERATRLEKTLRGVNTTVDLDKAYDLGAGLLVELDRADPERKATIDALYKVRFEALGTTR